MDDRRGFLGKVFGLAAAPILARTTVENGKDSSLPLTLDELNEIFSKNTTKENNQWKLSWTGWKTGHDNTYMAGQWLLWKKDGKELYYSSTPGGMNPYHRGDQFDISPHYGQHTLWLEDLGKPRAEVMALARAAQDQAYMRMARLPLFPFEVPTRSKFQHVCDDSGRYDFQGHTMRELVDLWNSKVIGDHNCIRVLYVGSPLYEELASHPGQLENGTVHFRGIPVYKKIW